MSNLQQFLPVPFQKQRYYTLEEVQLHNTANDCWIILFGQVYDLTLLIQQNIKNVLTRPLISQAGKDITYWFNNSTRQPRTKIDVNSGQKVYYYPDGKYLHLQGDQMQIKWWKDQTKIIGKLTKKNRKIKLINMITDYSVILDVPCQQSINEILLRYKKFNKHGSSYIWKRLGRPLDMTKTLNDNGIKDQDQEFQRLEIVQNKWYIPTIHLFFSDDLTVA